MNRFTITDPWIFFGIGGSVVAYLLYMMIGRPKSDRAEAKRGEPEL
jgi:hypothetical protein